MILHLLPKRNVSLSAIENNNMKFRYLITSALLLGSFTGLGAQEQQPFSRGFNPEKIVFVPKGTNGFGFSGSYTGLVGGEQAGFELVPSLIGNLSGGYNTTSAGVSFEYFIANNLSVGARFDYRNTGIRLDNARLSLTEDMAFDLSNLNYVQQSYLGALAVRYYVPFMDSKIFGWFVEGRLTGGISKNKDYKQEEELKHGIYQETTRFSLGAYPGICFFVAENVDFEVQVGLVDFGYQKISQIENQVKKSDVRRWNAKGRVDLLAIDFGVRFYFLDKHHSGR